MQTISIRMLPGNKGIRESIDPKIRKFAERMLFLMWWSQKRANLEGSGKNKRGGRVDLWKTTKM